MRIITSDGKKIVNIGSASILNAIFETVKRYAPDNFQINEAIDFMRTKRCIGVDGYVVGRQFNLIRDLLSQVKPEDIICDTNSSDIFFLRSYSPVITSCANLFTTVDGEDLFSELIKVFVYAKVTNVDIMIE